MRLVIQRSKAAQVTIDGTVHGQIDAGMVVLGGIEHADDNTDVDWLVGKLCNLRIFGDEEGKMNLNIRDTGGHFLVISKFTLHASTKKGNRPSYIQAARPEHAIPLYDYFIEQLRQQSGRDVQTGIFGADMQVSLVNDGPVTIVIDSKNRE